MRKTYINPTLDIMVIVEEDIITASMGENVTTPDDGFDLPGMDF